MAIEFVDSFDQGTTLQWEGGSKFGVSILNGTANLDQPVMDDGYILRISSSGSMIKFLPAVADRYVGFFYRTRNVTNTDLFLQFLSDTDPLALLRLNAVSQKLELVVDGALVATSTTVLVNDITYHLQVRYAIDNVTGTFEVIIDGTETVTFSGDTQVGAFTTTNRLQLGPDASLQPFRFYDSIITDDAAYPGIVRMQTQFPDADGFHDAWSKSTGASGFVLVDEVPPNDSDYVFAQTDALKQSVTFPDHGLVGATVVAVVPTVIGKKVSDGQISIGVRRGEGGGGTDFMNTAQDVGVNNTHIHEVLINDPSTATSWVLADVNDLELVVESEIV